MKNFNTNTENNDTWLTPPSIITSLGEFDLDPCSPINRPWPTAKEHYTVEDDGLLMPWNGRVWLNPPYGDQLGVWLQKGALHKNVTALIFARTETKAFQNFVFPHADSFLFISGRIKFHRIDGSVGNTANAPSILVAYDEYNSEKLFESGIKGHHIYNGNNIFIFGVSYNENKPWKIIVEDALYELKKDSKLEEIYSFVESKAPTRIKKNPNYKAKIRQVLQNYFERVDKGIYKLN